MRIESKGRRRRLGGAVRRRWLGWAAALGVLGLLAASGRAQSPAGKMKLQIGQRPIQLSYERHEIDDFGKPEEIHWITGSPACATAYVEGATVVLAAPVLTYRAQQGVFSATSGVTITDGTLSVQARQGRFDLAGKEAQFQGQVRWQRRQPSGQTSRGENEVITLRFGAAGVERIVFDSAPGQPGRMFLFPEGGALERFQLGAQEERPLPEPPRIERALAPLDQ